MNPVNLESKLNQRTGASFFRLGPTKYSRTPLIQTPSYGTYQSVHIIGVSVLIRLSDKKSQTHVLSMQKLRQTFLRHQNVVLIAL